LDREFAFLFVYKERIVSGVFVKYIVRAGSVF